MSTPTSASVGNPGNRSPEQAEGFHGSSTMASQGDFVETGTDDQSDSPIAPKTAEESEADDDADWFDEAQRQANMVIENFPLKTDSKVVAKSLLRDHLDDYLKQMGDDLDNFWNSNTHGQGAEEGDHWLEFDSVRDLTGNASEPYTLGLAFTLGQDDPPHRLQWHVDACWHEDLGVWSLVSSDDHIAESIDNECSRSVKVAGDEKGMGAHPASVQENDAETMSDLAERTGSLSLDKEE